jgi:hypothetical protein
MRGQAVDRVEAAAQVMRDFIKGQEAAARVDDAMAVVGEWLSRVANATPEKRQGRDGKMRE